MRGQEQISTMSSPRGLTNLGNTCYFNSIMQILLNAPLLGPLLEERSSISDNKYLMEDPNGEEQIELELPECNYAVKSFVDLYKTYTASKLSTQQQAIAPSKLIGCIRQKTGRFHKLVQEDSHELLRSLIDIIRSDEIRRHKAAISSYLCNNKSDEILADCFTLIDMIFGGYFLSSVKCQKCKFSSQHFEPFFDLSLAIKDPINDIRSAIANFTSDATLDGQNKFICEQCTKKNGKKTYEAGVKSTKITVPPNILTLHLKRFEASSGFEARGGGLDGGRKNKRENGRRRGKGKGRSGDDNDDECFIGGFRKINKHVEFTEFLDLSDFTSDLCYDLTKINKWPRIYRGDPIWYSLFGVVCHSGNLRSGHYTACVKCEDPLDDSYPMEEFADFIQQTPYIPELAEVGKIREQIKAYDSTRCDTTDKYLENDDARGASSTGDRPKSIPGTWYDISDSCVRRTTLSNVLKSQAYILFYRRVIEDM